MENRLCLNPKPTWDIEGLEVQIIRTVKGVRIDKPSFENPTIRINSWGTKCGRILTDSDRTYAREIWVKCTPEQKEQILNIDWIEFMEGKCTSFNKSGYRGKTMMPYQLKEELYKRFYGE